MQMADRDRQRVGRVVRRRRRPTTARLISAGVYSTTTQPASTAARRATPRACPSFNAVRALTA